MAVRPNAAARQGIVGQIVRVNSGNMTLPGNDAA